MNEIIPEQKYTPSEEKIISYISANANQFVVDSIAELAEKLEISEATVSRFAKRAGYVDFKDLKKAVHNHFAPSALSKLKTTIESHEDGSIHSWLEQIQYLIANTMENIDDKVFSQAVKAIVGAKRIFIHGKNSSRSIAVLLLFRMQRLGLQVVLVPSSGSEIAETLASITNDDIIIFFAAYSLSQESKTIMKYSKEIGFKTLFFTSKLYHAPEETADYMLYAYRGNANEYHSQVMNTAIADGLIVALAAELKNQYEEYLEDVNTIKQYFRQS